MRGVRLSAVILIGLAAAAYAVAAWSVRPGFYDGLVPVTPYRWVSPPPGFTVGNQQPLPGHAVIPVVGGSTAPFTTYTQDGQVILSFIPGSFRISSGQTGVTVRIDPETTYPAPVGFTPATNVYLVTADAPLAKDALIQLTYATGVAAPSYLYGMPQSGGAWKNLGASQVSQQYTISTRTSFLGYFVAGYTKASGHAPGAPTVGGGQFLPIAVAAVIVLVLVAGVPLALMRRRDADEEDDEA